jgi:hypothetical protein
VAKKIRDDHCYLMTLNELKDKFLGCPLSELKPIEVRNSGNRMSMIVYREPPFQVELVIWMPGCVVPAHRHPNIDSIQLAVSGELTLLLGSDEATTNELVARSKTWKAETLAKRPVRVRASDWHGGKTGSTGATFFSFQQWTEGSKQTAAGIDWHGPALVKPELAEMCV